jgi:hypothetical protein|tara:strand:+ start:3128 stop:3379 length:252 start_codon:yes stop_codon:yes gene_type:complete
MAKKIRFVKGKKSPISYEEKRQTRKFNGKIYKKHGSSPKKINAIKEVKRMRKKGYYARIKTIYGWGDYDGKRFHLHYIYIRKK